MSPRQLRQFLLIVMIALLGLGTVAVYSASSPAGQSTYGNPLHFVQFHVMALVIGIGLSAACLMVPYPAIRPAARWMLLLSIVLLVLVDLFGQEVGGARRWFRIGRFSLQPSEFAQLALVLYLSDLLARKGARIHEFASGVLPALFVTGLLSGLVLIQPDLGTAIVMGAVAMMLLVVARARWQHLAIVAGLALVLLVLLIAAEGYRRQRMMIYLNPWQDPQGSGYQIIQSYLAMASGGIFGKGLGASLQKLYYLPSAHTDFIFAIIGEEMGLIGTSAVLLLFAMLVTCSLRLATLTRDLFSKYLICGLVGSLGLEAILNVAVVTGMIPTKGLPLPLISYGGTSMMMNLVACACIFHASRHGEQPIPQRAAG